jgi:hypothetical protein
MIMENEFELLRRYMYDYVDNYKPLTLDYQIKKYSETGFIEEGHNGSNFIPFEIWKKLN